MRNLSAQAPQQKKYFLPECSAVYFALAGSTFIPQTGSRSSVGVGFELILRENGIDRNNDLSCSIANRLYWIHPDGFARDSKFIIQKGFIG